MHLLLTTTTPRRATLLTALAAVTTVVAACGGGGDAGAGGDANGGREDSAAAVTIKTFAFQPSPIKISAGTAVTWTNEDDILHTVTAGERGAADAAFDEDLDGPGSRATLTFDTPGTFAYHCSIHPGMDAAITVT